MIGSDLAAQCGQAGRKLVTDDTHATPKRGPGTWRYIQVILGFALTIEAIFIEMIKPLGWPNNVITFVAVAAFTIWAFLSSEWLHGKLLDLKDNFDDRGR